MPAEALSAALGASIYPPALAVVIALGRGADVRLRVVLFVVAASLTVFVTGLVMLFVFTGTGSSAPQVRTPSAALYVAGGVALLLVAARLRRPRRAQPKRSGGPSKTDRYLGSRRLVALLGLILYVVPSPIYVLGVKAIADTGASRPEQVAELAAMLLVMLWLIELPMIALIAFPVRAVAVLTKINAWFARHGRTVADGPLRRSPGSISSSSGSSDCWTERVGRSSRVSPDPEPGTMCSTGRCRRVCRDRTDAPRECRRGRRPRRGPGGPAAC